MSTSFMIIATLLVVLLTVFFTMLFLHFYNKEKDRVITYEQHIDIVGELVWKYERKYLALKVLLICIVVSLVALSLSALSIALDIQASIFIHLVTVGVLTYSSYLTYLNRDALVQVTQVVE